MTRLAWLAVICAHVGAAAPAAATDPASSAPSLDALIERFEGTPQSVPRAEVRLEAWIESGGGERSVVVSIQPAGETRLIADPGITIAPVARSGITWLVPLPHRHVDPAREYFEPLAAVRLPFSGDDGRPIELDVEYAYCVVDYQCFFGKETVTAALRTD